MLSVVLAILAQCGPEGPILCPTARYAFFEFAPSNGVGMGAACACTTPTGAKGEALTFTRASSGTCLKGSTTSGIANGDLVTCSTNQPRVMPGGDGTGGLGLLVEGARTNSLLRSQELENAAWATGAAGVAVPTVTVNAAVAPDGTTTAERVQIPATTAAQASYLFQAISLTGVGSSGIFVKGNGQSGTFDLCLFNNTAGAYVCQPCAYTTASWTLCKNENVVSGGVNATYLFGNASSLNAGVVRGAQDFFASGAQWEVPAGFLSSYIATAGAAVTRSGDVGYLSIPSFPASTTYSMASTAVLAGGTPTSAVVGGEVFFDATNVYQAYSSTNTLRQFVYIGGVTEADTAGASPQTLTLSASNRVSESYGGSTSGTICVNSTCSVSTLTAFTPLSGALRYYVGGPTTDDGSQGFAVNKRICYDPGSARCL